MKQPLHICLKVLIILAMATTFNPVLVCGQEASATPQAPAATKKAEDDSTTGTPAPAKANASHAKAGWAFFRGDSASTGVAHTELPVELDILWEHRVKKGAFEGTATIIPHPDNANQHLALIGDLDGKLFAFELASGELLWEFSSEVGFGTSPVVRDGRIFIGNLDGLFFCVNFKGEKVWSYQADGEINSSANFYQDKVLFGSQDANLYALDQKTGELRWKYESQDQIRCSITVAEDRAFVAGCDGFFHIVNLNDGSGAGKVEIHSPTGSTPASQGAMVFFGNQSGDFFAIDSQKVETAWLFPAEKEAADIVGGAAVNEEHVIFGNRGRTVYSLNPKTGAKQWELTLRSKIDSSPVIVGDRVYVASTDGRLYALTLKDGAILWERQFNGGFISSPAVAYGRLVIATNRGVVYCLGSEKATANR